MYSQSAKIHMYNHLDNFFTYYIGGVCGAVCICMSDLGPFRIFHNSILFLVA